MIAYSELESLVKIATSASHVKLSTDTNAMALLIKLCVNKVYELYSLNIQEGVITYDKNVAEYALAVNCIFVERFTDESGVLIDHHLQDSLIEYSGNTAVTMLFDDADDGCTILYKYIAEYEVGTPIVFSNQYLELFMTYLNYLIHRMVGFTDHEVLAFYRDEWLNARSTLDESGLRAVPVGIDDTIFNRKGFN